MGVGRDQRGCSQERVFSSGVFQVGRDRRGCSQAGRASCPRPSRFSKTPAHIRQSRPYSGLGFQVKILKPLWWCGIRRGMDRRGCSEAGRASRPRPAPHPPPHARFEIHRCISKRACVSLCSLCSRQGTRHALRVFTSRVRVGVWRGVRGGLGLERTFLSKFRVGLGVGVRVGVGRDRQGCSQAGRASCRRPAPRPPPCVSPPDPEP